MIDYPLPRPPTTLYGQEIRAIEQELLSFLDRHPDEGDVVDRIRKIITKHGGQAR